jgi:multidrug efflux pump subunit AcrA (membrane-fusion protein)
MISVPFVDFRCGVRTISPCCVPLRIRDRLGPESGVIGLAFLQFAQTVPVARSAAVAGRQVEPDHFLGKGRSDYLAAKTSRYAHRNRHADADAAATSLRAALELLRGAGPSEGNVEIRVAVIRVKLIRTKITDLAPRFPQRMLKLLF